MSTDNRKEALSEELQKELNEKLMKNENFTLPESLSEENMKKLFEQTPQNASKVEKETKKKRDTRLAKRFLSGTVAAAIVLTTVLIARPWSRPKPVKLPDNIDSYAQIEEIFAGYSANYKKHIEHNKMRYNFGSFNGFVNGYDLAVEEVAGSTEKPSSSGLKDDAVPSQNASSAENDKDFGRTNEQVEGVSEADIIKNDGKYLYIVRGQEFATVYRGMDDTAKSLYGGSDEESECEIAIVEPQNDGTVKAVSKITVAKPESEKSYYMDISDMYVSGDKLVAIVNINEYEDYDYYYGDNIDIAYSYPAYGCCGYMWTKSLTLAVAYDIKDRANPKESWRFVQDGGYISSRLIGDEFVLLSSYSVDISAEEEKVKEECVPRVYNEDGELARVPADCVCIMEKISGTNYLVATVLDTDAGENRKTEAVLGAGDNVYCTTETLYVTNSTVEDYELAEGVFGYAYTESTYIYKFDIRNYGVELVATGSVDGHALDQFSIDQYDGKLRIATTSGDWGENLSNQVYVLDEKLDVIGSITGIAPGETIKSVRFTGKMGYVVTFEQTDPLFVIDFSNPTAPVILGELKIPGFSEYMHPVGDGLVLGIGQDGDYNGAFWGSIKISLFDVSNPAEPKEVSKLVMAENIQSHDGVEKQHTYRSNALYDHKAICWDSAKKVMYIPYDEHFESYDYYGMDSDVTLGVLAVKIDEQAKTLTINGDYKVNAGENYNEINRTTFIGDTLFALVQFENQLYSFSMQKGELIGMMEV